MKILFSLILFVFLFGGGQAFARDQLAGTVERLRGEAQRISTAGTAGLAVGSQVFVDDVIVTGDDARLIIKFADDSTLTLGEDARIIVDQLVYDTNAGELAQVLDVVQGVFRFATGRVGKQNPSAVAVNTPVATIGIRGTEFIGGELTVGMPPGRPHYGFQVNDGAIEIVTPGGSVTLDEPGEGTFLPMTRIAAPVPPRQWTPAEAQEALDALAF